MAKATNKAPTKLNKVAQNARAAAQRDDTADKPVTELAHVDANTTNQDAKDISGYHGEDSSQQQKDAYEGVKDAREDAKHPDKANDPAPNPHSTGPGSDIA